MYQEGQILVTSLKNGPYIYFPPNKDKIRKLHWAVERGSLLDLQRHFTRKKYILGKDRGTGAGLLHKAIVLGHTDIVK